LVGTPQGEQYRFLYIFLYNRGNGWKIAEEEDIRPYGQILLDYGCEIVYQPQHQGDIAVGSKDGTVIGVASVYGTPWAIDLTDRSKTGA